MVAKWQNETFNIPVSEIRKQFSHISNEGMTLNEVKTALDGLDVKFHVDRLNLQDDLVGVIDENKLALICVDMRKVSFNDDNRSAIGRYYSQASNHAIVIKGYLYIDGVLYYQVYDPYIGLGLYPNNQPKGKDRLYPALEVYLAMIALDREYLIIDAID